MDEGQALLPRKINHIQARICKMDHEDLSVYFGFDCAAHPFSDCGQLSILQWVFRMVCSNSTVRAINEVRADNLTHPILTTSNLDTRDPWWVFCCFILFYVISKSYGMGVLRIVKKSPRFGILFVSIILALIFTCLDIIVSIHNFIGETDGINPFWKLSLVFKCLTDAILLDDFKTELKRLGIKRMKRDEKRRESFALTLDDEYAQDSDEEAAMHFSNGNTDQRTTNGYAHRASISQPARKDDNLEASEQVEFMEALNSHDSRLSSDRESRRDSLQRHRVGQGGYPATKLPRFFAAIKPGKKSKASKGAVVRNNSNTDSILSQSDEEEKTDRNGKKPRRDDDDIGPDEVRYDDDALEMARQEQARTIAELTRRKNSASGGGLSPPYDTDKRIQKKRAASRDFFHDLSDIDDDDSRPSSSHRP